MGLRAGVSWLLVLAMAGCGGGAQRPVGRVDGVVEWAGAQHKAIHDGDAGSKVRLADLARRPHLYAIGPLEGLAGEITVLDGRPTISTVVDGAIRTHAGLEHGAAFLVWTHAAEWRPAAISETVRTMADLERWLPDAARSSGLDESGPLAFRIDGRVEHLRYHVLRPPEAFTIEGHEKSKVHSTVSGRAVRMVGFFSTGHRGVFTPGTSDIHVHFVSEVSAIAGHVEDFTLETGGRVLLPVRGGA